MDPYALLYRSTARESLLARDLNDILETARVENPRRGITGLLLHGSLAVLPNAPGGFIQWMEGSEAAVTALFERIAKDPRHVHVTLVAQGPVAELTGRPGPLFGAWSMGFVSLAELPVGLIGFLDEAKRWTSPDTELALAA